MHEKQDPIARGLALGLALGVDRKTLTMKEISALLGCSEAQAKRYMAIAESNPRIERHIGKGGFKGGDRGWIKLRGG